MDDNQAILAELEAAWKEEQHPDDDRLGSDFRGNNPDSSKHVFALGYLSAKRKYDKAPEPVKTRMRFEEWRKTIVHDPATFPLTSIEAQERAWNAALANAQQDIQVGQPCQVFDYHKQAWIPGVYGASDSLDGGTDVSFWTDPSNVRPAPKTVELTDDEKVQLILNKNPNWTMREVADAFLGKPLDQLCAQFGVETTRSV